MIQPLELKETHPIRLHAGSVSTTTEVWKMLSASFEGDVDRVVALADSNPQLLTCQYDREQPGPHHWLGRARRTTNKSRTFCKHLKCKIEGVAP